MPLTFFFLFSIYACVAYDPKTGTYTAGQYAAERIHKEKKFPKRPKEPTQPKIDQWKKIRGK